VLRHQLIVLRRRPRGRVRLMNNDRWFFIQLYRWFPSILQVLTIIQPETLVRWHRAGFRCYWRWKSRPLGGRPPIETELRHLIRRMSIENSLWGAPRIHGELLKLGFEVAQSSVAKWCIPQRPRRIRRRRITSPHSFDALRNWGERGMANALAAQNLCRPDQTSRRRDRAGYSRPARFDCSPVPGAPGNSGCVPICLAMGGRARSGAGGRLPARNLPNDPLSTRRR
jgi:hypothetical protein